MSLIAPTDATDRPRYFDSSSAKAGVRVQAHEIGRKKTTHANRRPTVKHDAVEASEVLRRSITDCCVEDHRNDPQTIAAWTERKTPETLRRWVLSNNYFSVVGVSAVRWWLCYGL
jgi:hypothetical protein